MADRVVVYRWDTVAKHLEERLAGIHRQIESADNERTLWHLQGRAAQLRELVNLPDTLTVLNQ